MPYRVDVVSVDGSLVERLVELGALDVDEVDGCTSALMPDRVTPRQLKRALSGAALRISNAVGRDADSVWTLRPRPVRAGGVDIVPAGLAAGENAVRLIDSAAFGTGMHPTTALCLDEMAAELDALPAESLLDVGTGSGVLALAALRLGVAHVVGLDTDPEALRAAADNARLNGFGDRLRLVPGGIDAVAGPWPLVVANVLAAPLIEMAPALVRRIGHHGRLILSGIPTAVGRDVEYAYRRLGMHAARNTARQGWVALVMQASW